MSRTKKHHFISEFLLRGFADARHSLRVLPIDGRNPYISATHDLGHRNNAHTLSPLPGVSDVLAVEKAMAKLESEVASIVRDIESREGSAVLNEERRLLQHFIVMHAFRHPTLGKGVQEDMDAELGDVRIDPEWLAALTRNVFVESLGYPALAFSGDHVSAAEGHRWDVYETEFKDFEWTVQRFSRPSLVIGDRLVCYSGQGPRATRVLSHAAADAGIEGLGTCRRITVPLSPHSGLLLSRRGYVKRLRAEHFNRTTVRNSRSFIAYAPAWETSEADLFSSVAADFANQKVAYQRLVSAGLF